MRRTVLMLGSLALFAGVLVTLRSRRGEPAYSRSHPLSILAPPPPAGWEVRDTPIGATAGSAEAAIRALNFDDYVYRTYRSGGLVVRVYAAYWSPGRMDPSLISIHIPDICWVGSGATLVDSEDGRILPGAGGSLLPGNFRVFEFPHGREEVVYWHCVRGTPLSAAAPDSLPLSERLRAFGRTLLGTSFGLAPADQVFVRISTNRTIAEVVASDLWPVLTASLRPSGIAGPAR
jgi:hypothetical protein